MNQIIKKTAKKIHKTGFFKIFHICNNSISFKHGERVFSYQLINSPIKGIFRSGYVYNWKELAPTFESDYNSLGMIERSYFRPDFEQGTDNPDYIKRASLSIIGLNHLNQ